LRVRQALTAILVASTGFLLSACVGGANQNQNVSTTNANANVVVNPMTQNAPRPNVDSIEMLLYSALSYIENKQWDVAESMAETARQKAEQTRNDPTASVYSAELTEIEQIIIEAKKAIQKRDNNASALIERARVAVRGMKSRFQQ